MLAFAVQQRTHSVRKSFWESLFGPLRNILHMVEKFLAHLGKKLRPEGLLMGSPCTCAVPGVVFSSQRRAVRPFSLTQEGQLSCRISTMWSGLRGPVPRRSLEAGLALLKPQ